MATFDPETERLLNEAAERAVGFYSEKTRNDFDKLMEALDRTNSRFDDMVTKDEFNELKTDVKTIELAVRDTNHELRQYQSQTNRRLTKLENAVFHA